MIEHLYAVVDRLPAAWRPPRTGVAGASIVPRRVGDVVVVTSPLEAVPPPNSRTLSEHHDVLASLVDAPAALPVSYGVALPLRDIDRWLAAHDQVVHEALARVRGHVEMRVKLLQLDGAVVATGRSASARSPLGDSPGERDLRALAEHLVDRADVEHWRYHPSGRAANVVASVAFLVARGALADFLGRIAPIASRAAGVAVVPTGPWPCCSFVPDLRRLPLAAMDDALPAAASRRAG